MKLVLYCYTTVCIGNLESNCLSCKVVRWKFGQKCVDLP